MRPRLFWDDGKGGTFFATAGFTYEDRDGGTPDGAVLPQTGAPYVEALETRRYDAGASGQFLVKQRYVATARAAVARQSHDHQFGEMIERDRHETVFGEVAVRGATGRHTWVGGLAFERDAYTARDVPRFDYTFTVPGAFAQYDLNFNAGASLSASGRLDFHSEYGTFFSPRLSALMRAGGWTSRLSVGTGFFASTPLTEETEAAGLTRLQIEPPLEAERGLSASFDLTRTDGPLSYTATVFASRVADPVHVDRSEAYVLRNLSDPTLNIGLELLGTFRKEPFAVTGTYTYVHARETVDGLERDVAQTPRHSAGVVGMWEVEDSGRIGVEWYYTGSQRARREPLSHRQRALRDRRRAGGEAVRPNPAVRQRRESYRCAPDEVGSAAETLARGRWPVGRRCVGAAGRPNDQWRDSARVLTAVPISGPCSLRACR